MAERDFGPPGAEPLRDVEPVPVRVVFDRHDTGSAWQPHAWRPCAIEPADADADVGTSADSAADAPLAVRLFVDEAEGYYLNLTTADPSIFVLWRLPSDDSGIVGASDSEPPHALAVTVSYNEAGRWMDGGERVDRVPMPAPMQAWVAEYVTLHYVPDRGRKRKGARPSFMPREDFEAMAERERAIHSTAPGPSTGIGANPDPDGDAGSSRDASEP